MGKTKRTTGHPKSAEAESAPAGEPRSGGRTAPAWLDTPAAVLREAIRAVPQVKYALGVAGIVSAVAIVSAFGLDLRVAAAAAIVMLCLMVALVVFAKMTTTARDDLVAPTLALMWSALVLVI